jgi:hypothetical protein
MEKSKNPRNTRKSNPPPETLENPEKRSEDRDVTISFFLFFFLN